MNVGIVICARMQSVRLPGKVLLPTPTGESLLAVMLERVKRAGISPIIVATTCEAEDDAICDVVAEAEMKGLYCLHGPTDDVLMRIVETADAPIFNLDAVVRLTADCPLVDPAVISYCVETFELNDYDYVGTSDRFPDGMDVDVLSTAVLRKSLASPLKSDHEHVTLWAEREARCLMIEPEEVGGEDWSDVRVTVDEPADYKVIDGLLRDIGPNGSMEDYAHAYHYYPEYREWNGHLARNAGLAKSLAAEAL